MTSTATTIRDPELTRILDTAKGSMSLASDVKAELAVIAFAAGAIERHGDDGSDALGELSDYAINIRGHTPDTVQETIVRGIGTVLDERAEADAKVIPLRPGQLTKKRRSMKLGRLSEVQSEPVRWLWPDRIARKVVLFTGLPDCGKTTAAIDIAARVTTGREWPDDSGNAPQGSVIFFTAEDGLADTIRTRADAAGADVSRIYFLEAMLDENGQPSSFDLAADLVLLAEHVKAIGDVALIVIDPITAYLGAGKLDTHKMSDVRAVLSPLKDFADEYGVAVVGLTHPSKSVTKAMHAAAGSQGFVAAARAAWLFTRETDECGQETGRTLMLPIKGNLSAQRNHGLAYRIAGFDFGNGITAPFVSWDAEAVTITADQALAMAMESGGGGREDGDGDALGVAMVFLEDELTAGGSVEASVVLASAKRAGISERTLKRARQKLGVVSKREGFGENSKFFLSLSH
jgi:AAA domain